MSVLDNMGASHKARDLYSRLSDITDTVENLLEEEQRAAAFKTLQSFIAELDEGGYKVVFANLEKKLKHLFFSPSLLKRDNKPPAKLMDDLRRLLEQNPDVTMWHLMKTSPEPELSTLLDRHREWSSTSTADRAILSKAFSFRGYIEYAYALRLKNSLKQPDSLPLPNEINTAVIMMHTTASIVGALGGGSRKCPDALLLRGIGHYLMLNLAEAVMVLNSALRAERGSKHKWAVPALQLVAEEYLAKSRLGYPPLLANFCEMRTDSELGERYGSSYTQLPGSHLLYIFGGMRPAPPKRCNMRTSGKATPDIQQQKIKSAERFAEEIRVSLLRGIDDVPLGDLIRYDFLTESWRRISPMGGAAPSPRGYSLMKIDPDDPDRFYLMSGKNGYHSRDCFRDIWTFSLSSNRWKKLSVSMHHSFPQDLDDYYGDVIYKRRWYVVFRADGESRPQCMCFDLQTSVWTSVPIDGDKDKQSSFPRFQACSANWFHDNKLYLWTPELYEGCYIPQQPMTTFQALVATFQRRSVLWKLKFEDSNNKAKSVRLSWEADVIVGNEKEIKKIPVKRIGGANTFLFAETACVLSGDKVYLFGGWHNDFCHLSCGLGSTLANPLLGRYTSLCLELDLRLNCLRAVEASSHIAGPHPRAMSAMGIYENRLLIAGGYSTLTEDEDSYLTKRCVADEWLVALLTPGADAALSTKEPLSAGAKKADASYAGAGKGASAPQQQQQYQQPQQLNANENKCFRLCYSYEKVLANAKSSVTNNPATRQLVHSLHPQGVVGMLCTNVLDMTTNAPVRTSELFSPRQSVFMTRHEMETKWPSMLAFDREFFDEGFKYNTLFMALALFYAPIERKEQFVDRSWHRTDLDVPMFNSPLNKAPADTPRTVADPAAAFAVESRTLVDRCARPDCPSLSAFQSGVGCPRLLFCSRCKMVRYCSQLCQRAHYKTHKQLCAQASSRTGGGDSGAADDAEA